MVSGRRHAIHGCATPWGEAKAIITNVLGGHDLHGQATSTTYLQVLKLPCRYSRLSSQMCVATTSMAKPPYLQVLSFPAGRGRSDGCLRL